MSRGARVESRRWAMNAVGVEQQSPGSRSAPWVDDRSEVQTPTGFYLVPSMAIAWATCWPRVAEAARTGC
jgi:hypothetical protein